MPGPPPPAVSTLRRFLLWWFSSPGSPWVSINVAIDFSTSEAYLERVNAAPGARVSVQHLVTAAVARALTEHPEANARIIGRDIVPQPHVGVVMPVNLLGHAGEASRELGMALVAEAERLSLRQIAEKVRGEVRAERSGKVQNRLIRRILQLGELLPQGLMERGLEQLDRLASNPLTASAIHAQMPMTTGISNVGAAFRDLEGAWFRGASVTIPLRLIHIGTLWGIAPVQDEVVPVDGQPAVRPVLPVLMVFDHRLIDGVRAARLLRTFADLLADPEAAFGPEGRRPPCPPTGPR